MSIFSRLSDIMNSNINAALDHAEDPAKMVRLMIQEMEDTLVEVRATAARGIAERKDLERRLTRLEAGQIDWLKKAELAISKGREDLAKAALLEKAKLEADASTLNVEMNLLNEALDKHEGDIRQLETKLAEVKLKRKSIEARRNSVDSQLKIRQRLHDSRVDEAMARFDSIDKRIDETQGKVESYDMGRVRSLSEEIAELEIDNHIESELAAIKRRMGQAGDNQ